jgi:hypothetical protein
MSAHLQDNTLRTNPSCITKRARDMLLHMVKTVSMEKAKSILAASAKAINDGKVFVAQL